MRVPRAIVVAWLAVVLSGASAFAPIVAPAFAQGGPPGPPAVGVVPVRQQPITETAQFVGRVQAINRVALVARVTAYLEQRFFTEGTEVKQGDLLYRLEQPPFQADVLAKQAAIAQAQAQLQNATIQLGRAQALLRSPAGQQSTVDDALATQRSDAAQLLAAQANLRTSEINLAYTEIRAPVAGKIGRDAITVGNVVSPSSGALNSIVSQDPMYVTFPVSVREVMELRNRYAKEGGFNAVLLKIILPDGSTYGQQGKLDFIDNSVAPSTDTVLLRGVIPNPVIAGSKPGEIGTRVLIDSEFVTVMVEGIQPVTVLGVPRSAVMSDQQGSFVYVVGPGNKVEQRRLSLGQSTATVAAVTGGLQAGEQVVVDGVQRVRPGMVVNPGPASPGPGIPAAAASGGASPGAPTPTPPAASPPAASPPAPGASSDASPGASPPAGGSQGSGAGAGDSGGRTSAGSSGH